MIDKEKKYTTRTGLPSRIYATDGGGEYPVHGAIFNNGKWNITSLTAGGSVLKNGIHDYDLIEAKPRVTGWLNVNADGHTELFGKRDWADEDADSNRVACIEIDVEHGHGLEGK